MIRIWRGIWTLLLVLSVLAAPVAGMAAEACPTPSPCVDIDRAQAEGVRNTEQWERTYGPHELWDYQTNALYAAAFGTAAGGYNPSWLPVTPPADAIAFANAVSIARKLLSVQDGRLTDTCLNALTVASSYIVTDTEGLYVSPQGAWDIEFWDAGAMKRIGYVYVDGHTGDGLLLVVSLDQRDPYDEEGLVVIESPRAR